MSLVWLWGGGGGEREEGGGGERAVGRRVGRAKPGGGSGWRRAGVGVKERRVGFEDAEDGSGKGVNSAWVDGGGQADGVPCLWADVLDVDGSQHEAPRDGRQCGLVIDDLVER